MALECAGVSRLVETWNSFVGTPGFDDLQPVKKFENRAKATTRIWAAIQKLEAAPAPQAATPAPQAAPEPAKKAKGSKGCQGRRRRAHTAPRRQHAAGATRVQQAGDRA